MQYAKQFDILNLIMMPFKERLSVFNDEFVAADNFDEPDDGVGISKDLESNSLIASPYPFRLQFTMLLFCMRGFVRFGLNLVEQKLERNDLLIVQAGAIGQGLEFSEDCRIGIIAFSNNYFIPNESDSHVAIVMRKFLSVHSILHMTNAQMEEFLETYRAIRRKIGDADSKYAREILKCHIQVLYYNGCRFMEPYVDKDETKHGSRKKQLFDRFMQLLKQYYSTERSIGFYADKMCITPKYLSQAVYAVSGRHAGDWIRDYVILEAKALLRSRQYSVQQISDMLNFANQSFFGVYFKKAVGCSPSAYRNMG